MKILVSDFDKTLFDKNYLNNIKAVNDFVSKGNLFIIATGRHIPHLLEDLRNVKYSYLICNDGAVIYDKNLCCVYRKDIDNETTREITEYIKPEIGDTINDWYIDTTKKLTKDLNNGINAIVMVMKDINKSKDLLKRILERYSNVHGYISERHINIRALGTSKSMAIKHLIDKENIDKSSVYTVGDMINDLDMIEAYNGYCMANSIEEIKSKCINTVNSVEELVEKIK
jgi:HAD superfamily hydrolase (TIGR01484 family)